MSKRDYYESLGLSKGASDQEIKKAYKKLARQYHPDNAKTGDEDKFKEVSEAYAILSDAQKKAQYDQFGHSAFEQGGAGGFGGAQGFDFDDIFSSFFGGGFGGSRRSNPNAPRTGRDLEFQITIDFMDAVNGVEKVFELTREVNCPDCLGSGAKDGKTTTCSQCGGVGRVQVQRQTLFGAMMSEQACPSCNGTGQVASESCTSCNGQGRIAKTDKIKITIPAGIQNGAHMRIPGKGHDGYNGGPAGDLYVQVMIREHELFERQGNDVYCEVPITFSTAALGGTIKVPALDGQLELKIPEGTQTGTNFKLSGKGITGGNQYVIVKLITPQKLSKKQKEALKELAQEDGSTIKNESAFDKFKHLFD